MSRRGSTVARGQLVQLLGTLVALGLLGYLLSRQGWGEILGSVRSVSVGNYLLVMVLVGISRMAVAGRWYALLRFSQLGIPWRESLKITFAGLFASNFLPTSVGGDLVRLGWVVQLDTSRAKYLSSVAVDRLVGLAGMAVLAPLGIGMAVAAAGRGALALLESSVAMRLGTGYSAAEASALNRFSAPSSLVALAAGSSTLPLGQRVKRAILRTVEVFREWRSHPRALLTALGLTWLHMIFMFSAIRLLFTALGESIGFWQVAGLWSIVYLISLFPISINSLGLREVSTGLVYSTIGGTTVSSALTVALLFRTATMLASLPGAVSLPGILRSRRAMADSNAG